MRMAGGLLGEERSRRRPAGKLPGVTNKRRRRRRKKRERWRRGQRRGRKWRWWLKRRRVRPTGPMKRFNPLCNNFFLFFYNNIYTNKNVFSKVLSELRG